MFCFRVGSEELFRMSLSCLWRGERMEKVYCGCKPRYLFEPEALGAEWPTPGARWFFTQRVVYLAHMAKRGTTLSPKKKSRHSKKTKKRLAIKAQMLAKKKRK